jgi:hypothetical protein
VARFQCHRRPIDEPLGSHVGLPRKLVRFRCGSNPPFIQGMEADREWVKFSDPFRNIIQKRPDNSEAGSNSMSPTCRSGPGRYSTWSDSRSSRASPGARRRSQTIIDFDARPGETQLPDGRATDFGSAAMVKRGTCVPGRLGVCCTGPQSMTTQQDLLVVPGGALLSKHGLIVNDGITHDPIINNPLGSMRRIL